MILNKEESESLDYMFEHRNELFSEANKKLIELSKGIKKMKTFDRKDVFSWANCEEAKEYIGKEGYFTNNFKGLIDSVVNDRPKSTLLDVKDNGDIECFYAPNLAFAYGLFLPADKIKKSEKVFRRFYTFTEFQNVTNKDVGDVIIMRRKNEVLSVYTVVIVGVEISSSIQQIYLCSTVSGFTFEHLFNNYEWKDEQGNWQPFGIEEDTEVEK